MINLPKRIGGALNLVALVLISSFLQRNEVIQYVLLAVTIVIIVAVVVSALRGLSSKRFTLSDLLSQAGDDYVSLGIWLLVASLTFYLGYRTAGFVALGIFILMSVATLLGLLLDRKDRR